MLVSLFGRMLSLSWPHYYLPALTFLCLTPANLYASEVISSIELVYNGFVKEDLNLDGRALLLDFLDPDMAGLLSLTSMEDGTSGHAFCSYPLSFQQITSGSISSFSTTFVVAMGFRQYKGHGLAFMLSSTNDLSDNSPGQFLGLPSTSDHVFFAIELDTVLNPEFEDINDNHVGIDVNSLVSIDSHTAGFYDSNGDFQTVMLSSGKPIQVWVDYDNNSYILNVTLTPHLMPKPELPLLSTTVNLSSVLSSSSLYAGFSAASYKSTSNHYVLGWSLKLDGEAQPLDYSLLPFGEVENLARHARRYRDPYPLNIVGAPSIIPAFVLILLAVFICRHLKNRREDEELDSKYGPPSFTYKELVTATDGFSDRMLLGKGGFGRVYKGTLLNSAQCVAIKRVSPESKQGKREFMAEIAILGRVRHRNLVQLLGYCRYKKELLLVYDYMLNGSLDRYLYDKNKYPILDWAQRFHIIKGVASGIFYLHEDWECVIIHRDIKASNVLLDNDMNGRLSDFGLARLHDHGADAHTTHMAGTWGYIAPELAKLGKATKATDIFAFGVFMMEVVCGRRPIGGIAVAEGEPFVLADWVLSTWKSGSITEAVDSELEDYDQEDAELVLKLGLLCCHSLPKLRPCMRLVKLYLERGARMPEFCSDSLSIDPSEEDKGIDRELCPSGATTITILSGGR